MAEPPEAPTAAAIMPASATPALRASYDFFISGIPIAEVHIGARLEGSTYLARAQVLTRGVLELLIKGRIASQVEGQRGHNGRLLPGSFESEYETRTGERRLKIDYEGITPSTVSHTPRDTETEIEIDPKQQIGTLDPLSAALATLMPSRADILCNRTIPIFDGKRRYDVILLPPEGNRIDEDAPKPEWPKKLTRCFGVYERIGGFDPETLEDGKYFPFDIWFEETGDGVFRPVRLAGKTKLGYAIGDLRVK